MKKILVCIIIIIIIIISIFLFQKVNTDTTIVQNVITQSEDSDFILYIDNIKQDENNKIKVYGIISSGKISINTEVSIVGLGKKEVNAKIIKLEINQEEQEIAKSGDNVCITLDSEIGVDYIEVGEAMIIPATTKPIYNFTAKITETELKINEVIDKVNVFCINSDIKCELSIISESEKEIKISLEKPIVIKSGLEVKLKDENDVIAKAIVLDN